MRNSKKVELNLIKCPASNDMWGPDEGLMGGKCGPHYGLAPGIHIGASRGSPDVLKVGPVRTHLGPTSLKGIKVGLHPGSTWGPAVDAQAGFKWDLTPASSSNPRAHVPYHHTSEMDMLPPRRWQTKPPARAPHSCGGQAPSGREWQPPTPPRSQPPGTGRAWSPGPYGPKSSPPTPTGHEAQPTPRRTRPPQTPPRDVPEPAPVP
ncbi:hypothetical protein ROHU_008973 [Labeo rohita]|uniref:Uncharacterized protein n=1 Tax=Labeo rohita TaxID=84645 RepID=A0A498M1F0_LABRO|nr:hypothetical protein ROHU_008973 [Labeo rohita]